MRANPPVPFWVRGIFCIPAFPHYDNPAHPRGGNSRWTGLIQPVAGAVTELLTVAALWSGVAGSLRGHGPAVMLPAVGLVEYGGRGTTERKLALSPSRA